MGSVSSVASAGRGGDLAFRASGRARSSVTGVLWSFLNVGVSVGLTAAVFVVTSRILSPADFGAVALASAIVAFVGALVPVAFGEALIQRDDLTGAHIDSVFWLTMAIAAVACVAVIAVSPLVAEVTETPILALILPVLSVRLLFDAGLTVPGSLIHRRMQFHQIALRTALANGAGAALCLWMVVEGYALWALVFSQITTSVAALVVTLAVAKWRPGIQVSRAALGDLRNFGLFAMGGRVLGVARLDQLLLGIVFGPFVLGLYFFARRIFQMLCDVTAGVFTPVTNVMIASLQGDPEKRRRFYLTACFASASLSFPVFAGLIVIAPTAVPLLFGAQWTEAVFAVRCFALIGLMAGLGAMQAGLIRYLGRPGWWFWYQTAMQLSTLPLILVLAPFGLDAVMTGIVLKTLVLWPLSVVKAQSMLEMSFGTYLRALRAPAISALAMAVLVAVVPEGFPEMGEAARLFVQVAGGAAVYALFMVVLARDDIRRIYTLLRAGKERPV